MLKQQPIVCLVFNGSHTQAAVALYRSSALHILDCTDAAQTHSNSGDGEQGILCPEDWRVAASLVQHDGDISALAWHPHTDKLLSCGHDRAAYVWARDGRGTWAPQLVMVGSVMRFGLTSCAWSASGEKLYVGSAAAHVAVGRFDAQEKWWVCRALHSHESTVTALAPHPTDNALLASGALDGQAVLQSSLMKKVDGARTVAAAFGTVYTAVKVGAWVNAMAWSSRGDRLAIATHDACVHVLSLDVEALIASGSDSLPPSCVVIRCAALPLRCLAFRQAPPEKRGVSEAECIVGAGESYRPIVFICRREAAGGWEASNAGGATTASRGGEQPEGAAGARRHTRTIRSVAVAGNGVLYTAGMDGLILRWGVGDLTPL